MVRWSDSGDSIIISDINMFSEKVLPVYFNHNNYSSFIRQLNMYGFRKENKERKTKQEEYKNENFKRGHPELLQKIVRKKKVEEEEEEKMNYLDESRDGKSDFQFSSSNIPISLGVDLNVDDLKYISPEIIKDVSSRHAA